MADYLVHDVSLAAVADAIRAKSEATGPLAFPDGFVQAVERITAGTSVPAVGSVTFGREDGQPVQREQAYAVSAEDLNTLGTIVQSVSGRAALVTVEEMIYWLERAQFVPQGNALSSNTMGWRMASAAAGTILEA